MCLVLRSGKFLEAWEREIGTSSVFCHSFPFSNNVSLWHIGIGDKNEPNAMPNVRAEMASKGLNLSKRFTNLLVINFELNKV